MRMRPMLPQQSGGGRFSLRMERKSAQPSTELGPGAPPDWERIQGRYEAASAER